jgi:hypothetical protein
MAKALAFAAVVGCLTGCSPFGGGAFNCTTDLDCKKGGMGDGQCETTGFCSFERSDCLSGRAYGDHSGSLSNTCVGETNGTPDGKEPDAPQPEAGEVCFGSPTGYAQPCFSVAPSGTIMLTGTIDTGGTACSTMVSNTTACVIAAGTIILPIATTVAVIGPKPLVLVATDAIQILGTLDAASHHGPQPAGANDQYATTQVGAAADAACGAFATNPGDDGGGAGGTFGGLGGPGGTGGGAGAAGAGAPAPLVAIAALRGGCVGQAGAPEDPGQNNHGAGGHSGGAVWLIANGAITIGGAINASGEGGHPGTTGGGGAGGGGSGGMIGLDAPIITNTGAVFANGGAGGEGAGNGTRGGVGTEATSAAAAPAPTGISNGGDGAAGGANGSAGGSATGGTGANSGNAPGGQNFGGGGGGGGTGILKVFRGTLTGNFSPNPS